MTATQRRTATIKVAVRRRIWAFRSLAAGGALCAVLVLAEVALRLFAPLPYSDLLLWTQDGHLMGIPRPNQVLVGPGYEVRTNSLGFRGPDHTWTPASGTLRLIAFGGSSTFGLNASGENATWPERLQQHLSEALKMPVEVINFGLPGYDAFTSKINYLSTGRAFHPHVVLVYHTWNDLKFFRPLEKSPVLRARVIRNRPLWERIARNAQIARRIGRLMLAFQEREIENSYTSKNGEETDAALPVHAEALDWARQNFRDFASFARSDGALCVLITEATLAVPENVDKPDCRAAIRLDYVGMTMPVLAQTWTQMNDVIETVAAEEDAIFVNGYKAVPHDFEHLIDHVHLTDLGRDRLAEAIADTLLQDSRFLAVARTVRLDGKSAEPHRAKSRGANTPARGDRAD